MTWRICECLLSSLLLISLHALNLNTSNHRHYCARGVSTGGSGLRTYRYYDNGFGPPLFEFGFGLSLVNFSIAWATNSTTPATPPNVVTGGAPVRMTVTTQNMGDREGDNVVLVYHYPRTHASSFRRSALGAALLPQRRLVAFKRVSLQGALMWWNLQQCQVFADE